MASSCVQALLLGKVSFNVEITFPPQAGDYECRVLLNVGFQPYLYFVLQLSVEGTHPYAFDGDI